MKRFNSSTGLILVLLAVLVFAACGKKAEEPATAETGETAAEAPPPETPAEDVRGMFEAKIAEVDVYMKDHDVTNTDAKEIAGKLEGFQGNFEEFAAKASGDDELAAQCTMAAEAMALYVKGLRAPPGDLSSLELAIEAEAKWTEVKEAAAVEPKT